MVEKPITNVRYISYVAFNISVTKNFKCKECGLLYPTQDDLDLHFEDIHKE